MTPVFIVARRIVRETAEGQCDIAVHFRRVDIGKPEPESEFDLVFTTKDAHLAAQFPLGGRFKLTPEWESR